MKKTAWSLVISVAALLCAAYSIYLNFSSQRLAYVDSARLLNEYQGMIDAREAYQKKSAIWQANIDTLQSELTSKIMDYEKEVGKMTAKEKELSQELIRTRQQQFQEYQRAIQQQAQQEDAQMTQQVLDRINEFIQKYGLDHNYEIIFGTAQGNLLYANDSRDITDLVLTEINSKFTGN